MSGGSRSGGAVVLVPAYGGIDPDCDEALRALEKRGYEVRRLFGNAALDIARSTMATRALDDGFDDLVWVDSDMRFEADTVERLRATDAPFVAAIAPKKGKRELACHVLPETKEITFGAHGGIVELRYIGCAFVVTRRALYERMQKQLELPLCNAQFGAPFVPYFMPTVVDDIRGPWYLEGDYAFCERARSIGTSILADTRVRVSHVGSYAYSWEDAGRDVERFDDYRVTLR